MAIQYSNCIPLPRISFRCSPFRSPMRLANQASPAYSCLKNLDALMRLEAKVDPLLDSVKWHDKGLAVAITQNVDTGAVLMQGFVNREALSKTISCRKATFYSRSRSTLWTKGETLRLATTLDLRLAITLRLMVS